MEDYAVDHSTKLSETVPSICADSNLNFKTDPKAVTMETKNSKDSDSAGGSDVRKRTKPEGDASETGSETVGAIDDNFDWFDGMADDDFIIDGLQGHITSCNDEQSRSNSSASTEPSAKRHRR